MKYHSLVRLSFEGVGCSRGRGGGGGGGVLASTGGTSDMNLCMHEISKPLRDQTYTWTLIFN